MGTAHTEYYLALRWEYSIFHCQQNNSTHPLPQKSIIVKVNFHFKSTQQLRGNIINILDFILDHKQQHLHHLRRSSGEEQKHEENRSPTPSSHRAVKRCGIRLLIYYGWTEGSSYTFRGEGRCWRVDDVGDLALVIHLATLGNCCFAFKGWIWLNILWIW